MSRISVFELSFQAWVLHEFRRQILIAVFHQGTEVINHDLKFNMLSCSHSLCDMFFSKRKSRLTPKPSLRPDVLSRYRCKCYALTILSIMQDKSEKKDTVTIDDKTVDSLLLKMQNSSAANQFYPFNPCFCSLSLPPPLPRLPPLPPFLPKCFSVYFDPRQIDLFSILMFKASRSDCVTSAPW